MKCQECNYENLPQSDYCQDCGAKLKKHTHISNDSPEISLRHEIEKIDDVIFKPKKHPSSVVNAMKIFIILVIVGFIGLIGLIILASGFPANNASTDDNIAETDLTSFPTGYLEIQDLDSRWIGNQFYIDGILKNSYSRGAKNIRVRVDFYKDQNSEQLFDTRYITLLGVSANGAFSFDEPVYINPYDGQFWYVTQIESAEYLE